MELSREETNDAPLDKEPQARVDFTALLDRVDPAVSGPGGAKAGEAFTLTGAARFAGNGWVQYVDTLFADPDWTRAHTAFESLTPDLLRVDAEALNAYGQPTARLMPLKAGEGKVAFIITVDGQSERAEHAVTVTGTLKTLPGDADGSGQLDLMDLLTIIDHIVSCASMPAPDNADADGSGKVDLMDLLWIIDRLVGNG